MIVDITTYVVIVFLLWENLSQRQLIRELTSKLMAHNYRDYMTAATPPQRPQPKLNTDPVEDLGHIEDFTVR